VPLSEFAGSLKERIELWTRTPARLATGASSEDMNRTGGCLAAITSEGVGSANEAMSVSAMPRFRVTIRAQSGVMIDQQVRWRGKRLIVRQIIEDPSFLTEWCFAARSNAHDRHSCIARRTCRLP
jgi:head-tail adaptor